MEAQILLRYIALFVGPGQLREQERRSILFKALNAARRLLSNIYKKTEKTIKLTKKYY